MKSRNVLFFFVLPFCGIIIMFAVVSSVTRNYVKNNVEALIRDQLTATSEILRGNISHLLEEGYKTDRILELSTEERGIYYIALFDKNYNVIDFRSRFEGYLPVSQTNLARGGSWIIDSPAGRIFNILTPLKTERIEVFYLYLGYSMKELEDLFIYSRKNYLIVIGAMLLVGLGLLLGLYRLQNRYIVREKEAEIIREEKEHYREISAFTSGIAHEIKNPLNSLSLLLEVLKKKVEPGLEPDIQAGKLEIQKISKIIDRFSSAMKKLRLETTRFDLALMLKEVIQSVENSKGLSGQRIRFDADSTITFSGDEDLLAQAFINLLNNSIEATPAGRIDIGIESKKKGVLVVVRDEGKGMHPKEVEKAFDPFFSSKETGMGLGLYLAKKIIETHEGTIEIISQIDRGTSIIVHLPGVENE
ncbi:sensor histidine kinase [Acidobacteriota bacterium]